MRENKLKLQPSKSELLSLQNSHSNLIILTFYYGLGCTVGLLAIGLIFTAIFTEFSLSFPVILGVLACIASSLYIFKSAIWSTKGKENYSINESKLIYTADFGLFRNKPISISTNEITYQFKTDYFRKKTWYLLSLQGSEKTVDSVIYLTELQMQELDNFLSEWFIKTS